jgi:hypothetical protein
VFFAPPSDVYKYPPFLRIVYKAQWFAQGLPIGAKKIVRRFDAFVPEGQADRSQARSAWVAMQKGPVPEGRSIGSMVQSFRWDGAIFLMIPGTSCLATIVLSLRDKNHSPVEAPRIILAFVGKPWAFLALRAKLLPGNKTS